jgi:hypothetical protein
MAMNFPNNPTINDMFMVGLDMWSWNGLAWEVMPPSLESKSSIFTNPQFTGIATGTFSGNLTGNVTGNVVGNSATATKLAATKTINSVAFDGSANITVATLVNSTSVLTLSSAGNLTAPGNITTATGTVTAGTVTTTNDVTVGGNVNISTTPTAINHATNKRYVDAKAIAIAVAMS